MEGLGELRSAASVLVVDLKVIDQEVAAVSVSSVSTMTATPATLSG